MQGNSERSALRARCSRCCANGSPSIGAASTAPRTGRACEGTASFSPSGRARAVASSRCSPSCTTPVATDEGRDPRITASAPPRSSAACATTALALPLRRRGGAPLLRLCHHSDGRVDADVTVQTCWDADRLDLGRVGKRPDPRLLCTPAARDRRADRVGISPQRRVHRPGLKESAPSAVEWVEAIVTGLERGIRQ